VLTPQAAEALFATLRTLAAEGRSILYISHKLDEIRALCERATVLRAGRVTGECDPRRETTATLARMMIGSDLPQPAQRPHTRGPVMLAVDHLSQAADDPFGVALRDVSLEVHAGEIVGVAGVSGNGQQELLFALSGERPTSASSVRIGGAAAGALDADARRALGFAFVPEDRLGRGSVPEMSLADNALLTAHRCGLTRRGMVQQRVADAYARAVIDAFSVKAGGPHAPARSLSGGNLQKFIVGREIRQAPRVLVAAQPTWGVDVGAASQIQQTLIDLRAAGCAVLVISEELDELFEICDRIAVMTAGTLSPALPVAQTTPESIGLLMAGAATPTEAPA
jgi:simple sugar transport system ATP-binding protein